jgi:hypothetical protein
MAADKKAPDWERIEHDFRAGILSLREIAASNSLTEGAIRKRAKRDGWERDLGAKIQAKAEALVRKEEVRSEVRAADQGATERQIIDANATRIAQVRGEHRRDIRRTRELFLGLMAQLETVSSAEGKTLLGQLFTIIHAPADDPEDQDGKKRARQMAEMLDKLLSLPSNIDSGKKLTEMLEKLVKLEREAYDIAPSTGSQPADGVTVTFNDNELARRIAFTLAKGLKPQE